jgi:alkylresorcinol/alkylpyrone synthase
MLNSSEPAPMVNAVGTALPPNYVSQEVLSATLQAFWTGRGATLSGFERLYRATMVSGRYLALPIADYRNLDSFEKSNRAWLQVAPQLGTAAARQALSAAAVDAQEIDHIVLVTGTGIATPSIDTRIIGALGMRADVKRTPIFGLGCAAGAAGFAHAADYLRGFTEHRVLLIAVELCSVTLQHSDVSVANLIASGLFGDGAGAVVLSGGARGGRTRPQVIDSRSILYSGTENIMGWQMVDSGFKLVLSPDIPELVRRNVPRDVDKFLEQHGLNRKCIKHWIAHTGGPKVLRSIEEGLELPPCALRHSWESLRQAGNLSSASVLFVLADLLKAGETLDGDYGVMLALGPGFCLQMVLLRW